MAHMLDKCRVRRPFDRADILSRMGETICVQIFQNPMPKRREAVVDEMTCRTPCESAVHDEEPERWDGMS